MVAVKGKGWVLAPSLLDLVADFDKVYPQRDRTSDGSIGDQAHASRQSDHNPADGYVHAVDIDEDIAKGRDLKGFVKALEESRDARIRYVIYEGRILKAYASDSKPAWTWHRYTGPNAHEHHVHVSIVRSAAARNDTRPWPVEALLGLPQPPPEQEDDMPLPLVVKGDQSNDADKDAVWIVHDGHKHLATSMDDVRYGVHHKLYQAPRDAKGEVIPLVINQGFVDRIPVCKG